MCVFCVSLLVCVYQTMPTDMCALQDFDEPDKLLIQVNDVITIIEGRWVLTSALDFEIRGPPPNLYQLAVLLINTA